MVSTLCSICAFLVTTATTTINYCEPLMDLLSRKATCIHKVVNLKPITYRAHFNETVKALNKADMTWLIEMPQNSFKYMFDGYQNFGPDTMISTGFINQKIMFSLTDNYLKRAFNGKVKVVPLRFLEDKQMMYGGQDSIKFSKHNWME